MKSNVVLKSTDRELFGVTIRQQTKGNFFSITDLQKAYDKARWIYGWSEQNITSLLQSRKMQERLYHLLKERDLIKLEISSFMEMIDNEGMTKVLKGLGVWETKGRGDNKNTSADPFIWVLIAMEMNPLLYAKVVIWITDSLIFDRIDAGLEYAPMNRAIKSVLGNPDYPKFSIAINNKVFGYHQTGMRNIASAKELRKIADIEKFIINSIEAGFIKDEASILKAIYNYK